MCATAMQAQGAKNMLMDLDFKARVSVDDGPRLIFPLQSMGFGRLGGDGLRESVEGQFGLVPEWVSEKQQGPKYGRNCYNARVETVFEKPSFKKAILTQRAVVPVEAFYEFPDKESPLRHRLRVQREDGHAFLLGAIWAWHPGYGVTSVSVLTTEPMELLAPWHSRSPLILAPEQVGAWLDPAMRQGSAIRRFLKTSTSAGLSVVREDWAGPRQASLPFEDGLPE